MQSSCDCSHPAFLQCVIPPIKWNKCQSSVFILLKERRLGNESNKALCFSPEKRWNLLLLIISLLQHSVSGCNISPALLGWKHCPPPALSSATTNSSAAVPALPGLSQESRASLCLLWAAPGRRGGQNSYRNSQSLTSTGYWSVDFGTPQADWCGLLEMRDVPTHGCLGEGRWMCLYLNGMEHKATSPLPSKLCWASNHFRIQSGAPDPSFRFILEGKEWCFSEISHFSISHWPSGC